MHLFRLFGGGETARARCYELVSVWTLHLDKLLLSDALCSESVQGEGCMQLTPLHTHAKYLHGDHVIKSMVQLFNSLALSFCAFICGCTHTSESVGQFLWKDLRTSWLVKLRTFQIINRPLKFGHWSFSKLCTGLSLWKKNNQDVSNLPDACSTSSY